MSKTDKNVSSQSIPNRDINAASRASLAIKLRTQKIKYDDIAASCGYGSASAARKAVVREMQRVVVTNVEELRREELNFLDDLQQKCYTKLLGKDDEAKKGMLWAVDRLIAISERRSKLMGLDTPVSVGDVAANLVVIREIPHGYLEVPKSE